MAIEINVVNGIVNISTDGDVPRSYYGAVGASGSVMPMKAHLLGNVTEYSWVSAQEYLIGAGTTGAILQDSSSGLGTGAEATFTFTDSATAGATYISSIVASGTQNGKYKIGDSLTFTVDGVQVTITVKSLEYQRLLIKIGGDFYEVNWFDLVINGTSPTDFTDALSLISSAFASVGSPYKVYSALLTQNGINPPVATVLQNTIGNIQWYRDGQGYYHVYSDDALFTSGKTFVTVSHSNYNSDGTTPYYIDGTSHVYVMTLNNNWEYVDNILYDTSVEIRVYN